MSKKTIAFTMPGARRAPRENAPVVLDGITGESVAFAPAEESLRVAGPNAKAEEWVRDRPSRDADGPSPVPEPLLLRPLAVSASGMFDLAAERSLAEVMMLSFAVPLTLGWFWFAHAIERRQRLWGA